MTEREGSSPHAQANSHQLDAARKELLGAREGFDLVPHHSDPAVVGGVELERHGLRPRAVHGARTRHDGGRLRWRQSAESAEQ